MKWFLQNYQWIFSGIGVLFVGLIVQRWFSRRASKRDTNAATKVIDSPLTHSPVTTGQNNRQVVATQTFRAENIHIAHVVPTTLRQPSKTERLIPNLVYAGAKRKDIFINPWPREGVCDPCTEEERKMAIHAIVVKIENRVTDGGRKIARAMNVIAKLKFKHKNGVRERHIDYGVWLNSPCNSTDIGIGDTRELVLVSVLEDKLITFEDRRIDNRDFSSEPFPMCKMEMLRTMSELTSL